MKFLIIVAISAVIAATVSALPHEQQQKQQQYKSGLMGYNQAAPVQARTNEQHHEGLHHEKEIEMFDQQARDMDMDMDVMEFDQQHQRAKKSYGSGGVKCGKAVVVGCSPIVQKVKCKGGYSSGGHKGSYTENVPQYAYPSESEYEARPYIQYV